MLLVTGCASYDNRTAGQNAADTVYTNGKIYTVDEAQPWAEAVAIKDGKFVVVGSNADAEAVTDEDTEVVDLGGQFVMPGMTESHAHLSYTNNGPGDLDKSPVEEAMIDSVSNARVMLGSGFTGAISFGSVHRIDVFLRDAINAENYELAAQLRDQIQHRAATGAAYAGGVGQKEDRVSRGLKQNSLVFRG